MSAKKFVKFPLAMMIVLAFVWGLGFVPAASAAVTEPVTFEALTLDAAPVQPIVLEVILSDAAIEQLMGGTLDSFAIAIDSTTASGIGDVADFQWDDSEDNVQNIGDINTGGNVGGTYVVEGPVNGNLVIAPAPIVNESNISLGGPGDTYVDETNIDVCLADDGSWNC